MSTATCDCGGELKVSLASDLRTEIVCAVCFTTYGIATRVGRAANTGPSCEGPGKIPSGIISASNEEWIPFVPEEYDWTAEDIEEKDDLLEDLNGVVINVGKSADVPDEPDPVEPQPEKEPEPEPEEEEEPEPAPKGLSYVGVGGAAIGTGSAPVSTARIALDDAKTANFIRRIGSIIADNSFDRTVKNRRSGKLDGSSLHKLLLGSSRIFSSRVEREGKGLELLIVLDMSGSMTGSVEWITPDGRREYLRDASGMPVSRVQMGAEFATLCVEGWTKCGANAAVLGYNNRLRVFKDWEERNVKPEKLRRDLINGPMVGGNCNHDFSAVRKAQEMIAGRKGKKKIVLWICDGGVYRCGAHATHHDKSGKFNGVDPSMGGGHLKGEARKLAEMADVITIGIASPDVAKWYPNAHIVSTKNEFIDTMLQQLPRLIKRQ